jgi:hypothetical protein
MELDVLEFERVLSLVTVCLPGRMRKKNAIRIILATARLLGDGAAVARV